MQPQGQYAQRTLTVPFATAAFLLASTADGSGELCTDDQVELTLTPSHGPALHWSHQFASSDRRSVVCLPPQPLSLPAGPGTYTVTIALDDLYPDTFGSRAYYLIIGGTPASGAAIAQPTPASHRVQPTPLPVSATSAPQRTTIASSAPRPASSAADAQHTDRSWAAALAVAGLMLGVLLIVLFIRRRRATAPQLHGVLYLFDQASREARTIALAGEHMHLDIRRRPLSALPPSANDSDSEVIARLQATARGPLLFNARASGEPIALEHDQTYALGGGNITLRYRGEDALPNRARTPAQRSNHRHSAQK